MVSLIVLPSYYSWVSELTIVDKSHSYDAVIEDMQYESVEIRGVKNGKLTTGDPQVVLG